MTDDESDNDRPDPTASHELKKGGPPEARVPGDELHELIDSWEWMYDAAEPSAGNHDELAEMYQMAVSHCIADLRRVLSRHE